MGYMQRQLSLPNAAGLVHNLARGSLRVKISSDKPMQTWPFRRNTPLYRGPGILFSVLAVNGETTMPQPTLLNIAQFELALESAFSTGSVDGICDLARQARPLGQMNAISLRVFSWLIKRGQADHIAPLQRAGFYINPFAIRLTDDEPVHSFGYLAVTVPTERVRAIHQRLMAGPRSMLSVSIAHIVQEALSEPNADTDFVAQWARFIVDAYYEERYDADAAIWLALIGHVTIGDLLGKLYIERRLSRDRYAKALGLLGALLLLQGRVTAGKDTWLTSVQIYKDHCKASFKKTENETKAKNQPPRKGISVARIRHLLRKLSTTNDESQQKLLRAKSLPKMQSRFRFIISQGSRPHELVSEALTIVRRHFWRAAFSPNAATPEAMHKRYRAAIEQKVAVLFLWITSIDDYVEIMNKLTDWDDLNHYSQELIIIPRRADLAYVDLASAFVRTDIRVLCSVMEIRCIRESKLFAALKIAHFQFIEKLCRTVTDRARFDVIDIDIIDELCRHLYAANSEMFVFMLTKSPLLNQLFRTEFAVETLRQELARGEIERVGEVAPRAQCQCQSPASHREGVAWLRCLAASVVAQYQLQRPAANDLNTVRLEALIDSHRTAEVSVQTVTVTQDVPLKTQDVPRKTQDVPRKTQDVPRKTQDVPLKTQDVPLKTQDVLRKTQDVPLKTQDVLRKTQDVPLKTQDVLRKTQDVPLKTQDVPRKTQDVLRKTQDVPRKTQDVPLKTQDVPLKTQEVDDEVAGPD